MNEICKDCYHFKKNYCTIKNTPIEYDADPCILFFEILPEGIIKSTPGMN